MVNSLAGTLVQRCQVHKMRNIINKLSHLIRATPSRSSFISLHRGEAIRRSTEQAQKIIEDYQESFPAAMQCRQKDLEEVLTALQFPLVHRARIKKTNLLERLFGEDRRRTEVIPRFRSETSALWLVFAVLVDVLEGWRGVG